jgi:chromosome segregation ATPase
MSTVNVNEEIRKLDLSLQSLNEDFSKQIQALRTEFQSLIKDIESSRDDISTKLTKLNENSREITNLSENAQKLTEEVKNLEAEILSNQQTIDNRNNQITQVKEEIALHQKKISEKENESLNLESNLKTLRSELDGYERINIELKPRFDFEVRGLLEENERLSSEKTNFEQKVNAVKLLCKNDYIQSREMDMVKYFIHKPAAESTLAEVRASMAMDPSMMQDILSKLAKWKVVDYNEPTQQVKLIKKIDLFEGGN